MPYLPTAQSWLEQSTLLLKARPTTTRVSTKYTLLSDSKISKLARRTKVPSDKKDEADAAAAAGAAAEPPTRATLTVKAYDSASGTTLKYRTTKAAEVSRLIQILGRLARPMAGLEEKEDIKVEEGGDGAKAEIEAPKVATTQQATGGAGKGKKKKGKK